MNHSLLGLVLIVININRVLNIEFSTPHNFGLVSDAFSFITVKKKFGTTDVDFEKFRNDTVNPKHFEYMMQKYSRELGSQLGDSNKNDIDDVKGLDNYSVEELPPQNKILQLIQELAKKGVRVNKRLQDINEKQEEEHFPWKYMTEDRLYAQFRTPVADPPKFNHDVEKERYKNKTEEDTYRELKSLLKETLTEGDKRRKELEKKKPMDSLEMEVMREYYRQTKDGLYRETTEYTTWDGGEGQVTRTPDWRDERRDSSESKRKMDRDDTNEVYNEAKDREAMNSDDRNESPNESALRYAARARRGDTTTEINKVTVPWKSMSNVMWYYLQRVRLNITTELINMDTYSSKVNDMFDCTPVLSENMNSLTQLSSPKKIEAETKNNTYYVNITKTDEQNHNGVTSLAELNITRVNGTRESSARESLLVPDNQFLKSFIISQAPNTETTTSENARLKAFVKLLTELGETLEPPTPNFKIERFPTRKDSEELHRRDFYSKHPHFIERIKKRIDSEEMQKRSSRLAVPTTTCNYSTFYRRTYNAEDQTAIDEFLRLNKMGEQPEHKYKEFQVNQSYLNELKADVSKQIEDFMEPTNLNSLSSTDIRLSTITTTKTTTTTPTTTPTTNIATTTSTTTPFSAILTTETDKPKNNFTRSQKPHNKTMSYAELSSVMEYYAQLLEYRDGKLIMEGRGSVVITTSTLSYKTPLSSLSTLLITIPEGFDKFPTVPTLDVGEHIFNAIFDPFRHEVFTHAPNTKLFTKNTDLLIESTWPPTYYRTTMLVTTSVPMTVHETTTTPMITTGTTTSMTTPLSAKVTKETIKPTNNLTNTQKQYKKTMFSAKLPSVMEYYTNSMDYKDGKLTLDGKGSSVITTSAPSYIVPPSTLPITIPKGFQTHLTIPTPDVGEGIFNAIFDPFRQEVYTHAPNTIPFTKNVDLLIRSMWPTTYYPTTTLATTSVPITKGTPQIPYTKEVTTKKIYTKADVQLLLEKTMEPGYDPFWRANYYGKNLITTTSAAHIRNIYDNPYEIFKQIGVTESNEATKTSQASFYPNWHEINEAYFNSTSTIYPNQITPKGQTRASTATMFTKFQSMEENTKEPKDYIQDIKDKAKPEEDADVVMRSSTHIPQWMGYKLDTTRLLTFFPTFVLEKGEEKECSNKGTPKYKHEDLDMPEDILEKRVNERDEEDAKMGEESSLGSFYNNLTESQKIDYDRKPVMQMFDEPDVFDSDEFKSIEPFNKDVINKMRKGIAEEIKETRQKVMERRKKKYEEEIAREITTTESIEDKNVLRIDKVKFKNLDDEEEVQDNLHNFKEKLKMQFDIIHKTVSTQSKFTTVDPMIVLTYAGGKLFRKIRKIKRRRTSLFTEYNDADKIFIQKEQMPAEANIKEFLSSYTSKKDPTNHQERAQFICNISEGAHHIEKREISGDEDSTTQTFTQKTRRIERVGSRKFTLAFERSSTCFSERTSQFDAKSLGTQEKGTNEQDSIEKRFHRGDYIMNEELTEGYNPSLEKMIADAKLNLTEKDMNQTQTEEEREIDEASEKYYQKYGDDIPGYARDYDGNLVPTLTPEEVKKENEAIDQEYVDLMRKARGEFDRVVSQDLYDVLKEQREVRMANLRRYCAMNEEELEQEEEERRKRKNMTTSFSRRDNKNEIPDIMDFIDADSAKETLVDFHHTLNKTRFVEFETRRNSKTKTTTMYKDLERNANDNKITTTQTENQIPNNIFEDDLIIPDLFSNQTKVTSEKSAKIHVTASETKNRTSYTTNIEANQIPNDVVEGDIIVPNLFINLHRVTSEYSTKRNITTTMEIKYLKSHTTNFEANQIQKINITQPRKKKRKKLIQNTLVYALLKYREIHRRISSAENNIQFPLRHRYKTDVALTEFVIIREKLTNLWSQNKTDKCKNQGKNQTTQIGLTFSTNGLEFGEQVTSVDIVDHPNIDRLAQYTQIGSRIFQQIKQDEDNLYYRYHRNEISHKEFQEGKSKLIEKAFLYTKSTERITFPTFVITSSILPDLSYIKDRKHFAKVWWALDKKGINFTHPLEKYDRSSTKRYPYLFKRKRRMLSEQIDETNNTDSKDISMKQWEDLICKYYERKNKFNEKSKIVQSRKEFRKNYLKAFELKYGFDEQQENNKIDILNLDSYHNGRNSLHSLHEQIEKIKKDILEIKENINLTLSHHTNILVDSTNRTSKENKQTIIQKQFFFEKVIPNQYNLNNQRNKTKEHKKHALPRNLFKQSNNRTYEFIGKNQTHNESQVTAVQLVKEPFLYQRLYNGKIRKFKINLIRVPLINKLEIKDVEEQFDINKHDSIANLKNEKSNQSWHHKPFSGKLHLKNDDDFLVLWKTMDIEDENKNNSTGKSNVESQKQTTKKEELSNYEKYHPYTLVTMVSNLYNERMKLQNLIKYQTTTLKNPNTTYLYELFGFNTGRPDLKTNNRSIQMSLFRQYRSTIADNYANVSKIQYSLQNYTKNLTFFSKDKLRHYDVFFYEKNIPTPRRLKKSFITKFAPGNGGVAIMKVNGKDDDNDEEEYSDSEYSTEEYEYSEEEYESDEESQSESEHTQDESERKDNNTKQSTKKKKVHCCCHHKAKRLSSKEKEEREFDKFINERKCIRTMEPMRFAWEMKSSLIIPETPHITIMNPDPEVSTKYFRFEEMDPP